MYLDANVEDLEGKDPKPRDVGWIRLAHVCQHWRALALGSPGLWTNIEILSDRRFPLVELQVERSKALPLSVQAHITYNNCKFITETISRGDVLQRLEVLKLSFGSFHGQTASKVLAGLC